MASIRDKEVLEILSLLLIERAVDVVYTDFSEAFHIVSHNTLTEKLMKCRLDEQ